MKKRKRERTREEERDRKRMEEKRTERRHERTQEKRQERRQEDEREHGRNKDNTIKKKRKQTSKLLQTIGLFCKTALSKRLYSAKEIYNFRRNKDNTIKTKQKHRNRHNNIIIAPVRVPIQLSCCSVVFLFLFLVLCFFSPLFL